MSTRLEEQGQDAPSIPRLWFGFLAGPIAWVFHLYASYAAVPYLCGSGWGALLHVFTVAALALAGAGFFVALSSWRTTGRPEHTRGGGVEGRSSLLSVGGLGTGAFFFLVILAQSAPNYFLNPCQ